ncbi:Coiled-coil alpha-helical rod protein 1 [Trichoplax sp. H2]|nr:Coiled-coil alpha-helical rod protein 1 [Trichoplax sp. H2]|eukprot:RDD45808.1 Coiled-coil alpha-helical rod protein 1 [Trichoplax sp. H2]
MTTSPKPPEFFEKDSYMTESLLWPPSKFNVDNDRSNSKLESIQEEINDCQSREKDKNDYQLKISDLEAKLNQNTIHFVKLNERLIVLDEERMRALERVSETEKEKRILEQNANRDKIIVETERHQLEQKLRNEYQNQQALQNEITRLRAYIGNDISRNLERTWQEKATEEQDKNKRLTMENERLQDTIELSNLQISALNDMVEMLQNQIINKSQESLITNKEESLELLSRWRQKVYSLLLQLKSNDLAMERLQQQHQQKISSLHRSLEETRNDNLITSRALANAKAQIQIEINHRQNRDDEIKRYKIEIENLRSKLSEDDLCITSLKTVAESMTSTHENFIHLQNKSHNELSGFNERLNFACSRLKTLQGLLVRQATLSRMYEMNNPDEKDNAILPNQDTDQTVVEMNQDKINEIDIIRKSRMQQLETDLQLVTADRDRLAKKISADCELFESKIFDIRTQYQNQIEEQSAANCRLKDLLSDKEENCKKLSRQLELKVKDFDKISEEFRKCQEKLSQHRQVIHKEVEISFDKERSRYKDELAQLQNQLHEARKERVKTVITAKQIKRHSTQEIQRMTQLIETERQELLQQVNKYVYEIRSLEKERNLLMVFAYTYCNLLPILTNYIKLRQASLRREGIILSQRKPLHPTQNGRNKDEKFNAETKLVPENSAPKPLKDDNIIQARQKEKNHDEIENIEDLPDENIIDGNQSTAWPSEERIYSNLETKENNIDALQVLERWSATLLNDLD